MSSSRIKRKERRKLCAFLFELTAICENGSSCLPLRLSSVKLYWRASCDCVRTKEGGSKVNWRHEFLSIHFSFAAFFFADVVF